MTVLSKMTEERPVEPNKYSMAYSYNGALSLALLLELGVTIHEPGRSILACCDSLAETSQLVLSIKPKQNQPVSELTAVGCWH